MYDNANKTWKIGSAPVCFTHQKYDHKLHDIQMSNTVETLYNKFGFSWSKNLEPTRLEQLFIHL